MSEPLGLIAGNGQFPLLFAQAAKDRGEDVVATAFRGETEQSLEQGVGKCLWVHVGQLGKMLTFFEKAGVKRVAMAGGIDKTRLFRRARLDWQGLKLLTQLVRKADDGVLRALARLLEERGMQVLDSTIYLPELMAPSGVLTQRLPSKEQEEDLLYGFHMATKVGQLDIGQTLVVHKGAVVAVEAIEGTDACIARAGQLIGSDGGTVVKVAKAQQDMRFDVPAVGLHTITSMHRAGLRVLGIEAGRTLLFDPEHTLSQADQLGITIVSRKVEDSPSHLDGNAPTA
jgi:UDP-2,3-diacylglucosamine hydrolase